MAALFENAGQHVHGKQVEQAVVVLAHDHMDGETLFQVQPAGVDVRRKAGVADDLLYPLPGGIGDTGPVIEYKRNGGGGDARHAGNITDGQLFHNNLPNVQWISQLKLYAGLVENATARQKRQSTKTDRK